MLSNPCTWWGSCYFHTSKKEKQKKKSTETKSIWPNLKYGNPHYTFQFPCLSFSAQSSTALWMHLLPPHLPSLSNHITIIFARYPYIHVHSTLTIYCYMVYFSIAFHFNIAVWTPNLLQYILTLFFKKNIVIWLKLYMFRSIHQNVNILTKIHARLLAILWLQVLL